VQIGCKFKQKKTSAVGMTNPEMSCSSTSWPSRGLHAHITT